MQSHLYKCRRAAGSENKTQILGLATQLQVRTWKTVKGMECLLPGLSATEKLEIDQVNIQFGREHFHVILIFSLRIASPASLLALLGHFPMALFRISTFDNCRATKFGAYQSMLRLQAARHRLSTNRSSPVLAGAGSPER
jgi:hypothetical protein